MAFFKRIFLFVLVNLAVILVFTSITSLLGLDTRYLTPNGLNLTALAIFSAIFGFTGSFVSLLMSRWIAKMFYHIKPIQQPSNGDEALVVEIVKSICQKHNLPVPEIGIYQSNEVNAFATGWSKKHSLVAVSSGLLHQMDRDEVEGVIGHEMAHIYNGDMVTMTLLQGVLNTFVIFFARLAAYGVQRAMGRDSSEIGGLIYFLMSIVFEIIFMMLASTIIFAYSRKREFVADKGGALFVGKSKMIAALKKLQSTQMHIDTTQKSLATMKISDKQKSLLFSTHPPLEKRIEELQKDLYSV